MKDVDISHACSYRSKCKLPRLGVNNDNYNDGGGL